MPRRRNTARRVRGPYKHRNRWRVVLVTPGSTPDVRSFESEAEALEVKRELEREIGAGLTVADAIAIWEEDIATTGVAAVTVETNVNRARKLLRPAFGEQLANLTPKRCAALYAQLRRDPEVAVATHRNALIGANQLLRWCVQQGHLRVNPAAMVEPVGTPRRGKPQLRVAEARRLVDVAMTEADCGDQSAIAVLIALLLGRRASEVVWLDCRDVDDGGALLWIAKAKTEAGKVVLEVPMILRPILVECARGRSGRLFPDRTRYWVYWNTRRLCRLAGVPVVPPHGLRGTHATLATQAGATAELVMTALGHTSTTMAQRHYLAPGTRERASGARAAERLLGAGTTDKE